MLFIPKLPVKAELIAIHGMLSNAGQCRKCYGMPFGCYRKSIKVIEGLLEIINLRRRGGKTGS